MNRHLIIFTRAPQLGRVKRRLAAEIGALAALRFHRAMLARLAQGAGRDRRWKTWVAITPDVCPAGGITLLRDFAFLKQGGGDLGDRMARCFRPLPPGPAILVGSDIPDISARHIASAFAALGRNDFVFGPASDGGYWLVGLRRTRALTGPHGRNLFTGVRWSGPDVLQDTITALGPRTHVGFTATLSDVDNAADYHHWRRLCSSRRGMISTKLHGLNR
ncbi:MAG: glycosyltransferase [Alphaproteobacteria bacterium]|nr:glycosyltransferase [Alphaproteobacteria bacterium]